jgi:hypothetical protein
MEQQQNILAEAWKRYMKDSDAFYTDATWYESEMGYPTDQRLLWEWNGKAYPMTCMVCQRLGMLRLRTKWVDVEKANLTCVKQRMHIKSHQRRFTRCLIGLSGRMLAEIRKICRGRDDMEDMPTFKEKNVMETVTKVYRQRKNLFGYDNRGESISDGIGSISKP